MKRMIDIHTHILYGVDDGAKSMEMSLDMLQDAAKQGITDIILTPHYRKGMFSYPVETILKHFLLLKKQARPIGVQLYLGSEYHVNDTMVEYLKSNRCLPMNLGKYVLAEYRESTEYDVMCRYTQELIQNGYIPIIAHIERYDCLVEYPELVAELSELGALMQLNADSILGLLGHPAKRFCHRILKHGLADFVASDAHGCQERANHLGKCCAYVEKKYGTVYAEKLFYKNAECILDKK